MSPVPTVVPQSIHDPIIDEFLQWRKSAEKMGRRGSNNDINANYIPENSLKTWLTQTRIQGLLKALFKDDRDAVPDASRVIQHYLRPFAILLTIGCGSMIRLFMNRLSLRDSALPFFTEPAEFPTLAGSNLFQSFYNWQWHFYPTKLEYNMADDLSDDYILPMVIDEQRGSGGSAVVYKVTVDPEYNGLIPGDGSDYSTTRLTSNTFALKTYRRNSEAKKYFDNECTAYKRLRYQDKPHANIIGYYGSFVRYNTYNIILEYADRGTLNDFLQETHEPTNSTGIMTFWTQFLGILHGLAHIHGTPGLALEDPWVLLGWHHDLTPDNILVVTRNHESPYNCEFKIADFGLAHFQRFSTSTYNATDMDQHGSNAYSAPEAYRSSALEKARLQVPQNVEIWSIGCILSEVATWITEGMPKVLEYRRRRAMEVHSKISRNEELFFHNYKVLEAVKQMHEEIKQNSRPTDRITDAVIQRLVKAMMIIDHHARAPATHFLDQSRQILDEARPAPGHTVSDEVIGTSRPRLPPNLPPGLDHITSLPLSSDFYPARPAWNTLLDRSSTGPISGLARQEEPPNFNRISANHSHLSHSVFPSRPISGIASVPPQPSFDSSTATDSSPLRDNQRSDSQLNNAEGPVTSHKPPQDHRLRLPFMSVKDGLKTKRDKDRKIPCKYIGEDLIYTLDTVLKIRDHVFLVDNAASMGQYKHQVRDVLELLSSLTERYDPNGLDLYFTTEPKRNHKPNGNKKMLKIFDEHPAHSVIDMRECFASIMEPYRAQFGQRNLFSKLRQKPSKGPRKISLYILTDGVWDPECDLVNEVKALVASLQKKEMPDKHVGIQFIRFGDDPKAIDRLEKLDSGLSLELDIIDHTSAKGNVWKMLLGPLNPWIDDDRKGEPRHEPYMNGVS